MMTIGVVTLLLLIAVVTAQNYRLLGDTVPISYDLTVTVPAVTASNRFTGILNVMFKVVNSTNKIIVHKRNLIINPSRVAIRTYDNQPFATTVAATEEILNSEYYQITLTNNLIEGDYRLVFGEFSGNINEFTDGIYNADGTWNHMQTQFMTTGARNVFPCWDEPRMKATLNLVMFYPNIYTAVLSSSTYTSILPGRIRPATYNQIIFPTTQVIPPQTMSWAILWGRNTNTKDSITVWTTMDIRLTDTALNAAVDALKQLKDYLNSSPDTPRRVEKLDMITTTKTKYPSMNNWGLQIYSENAIEFYEMDSSTYEKQRVWQIVTRESAHQWFGDVVTPAWWDEIWLSVGFATYFEYFALAKMQKDWRMEEQFVVQQTQVALQLDCYDDVTSIHLTGKHKKTLALIIPKVETTSDIEKIFNNITYNKGASVIRMLHAMMGEENFKKGTRSYLLDRQYKTVNSEYLWTTMATSLLSGAMPSGLTLPEAMKKWTTQPGFPEIVATRDYNTDVHSVKFSQSQFLIPPHTAVNTITWNVPIFWTTENDPDKTSIHWLQPDVSSTNQINLPSVTDDQWLLINKDHAGYYRVNYDQKNWQLLSESFLNLTISSRAMILDDALNLARGGRLDYTTALGVTELLPNETNFAPWSAALSGLGYLHDRLSNDTESRQVIDRYILGKLDYVYDNIGGFRVSSSDSHVLRLMKQLVLHWACRVGHATCIKDADDLYDTWTISSTSNPINPDLRRVTYCTAVHNGGKVVFNRFLASYAAAAKPDKPRIVYALGCANDSKLLNDYLIDSLLTAPTTLKPIIGRQIFTAVCQNPIGVQLAFNFLMTHWCKASTAWDGLAGVGRAFSEDLAPKLNTPEQLKQLKILSEYNTLEEAIEGIKLAIGTLEDTLVWQENHRKEVISAMGGYRRPPPTSAASSMSISITLSLLALFIKFRL